MTSAGPPLLEGYFTIDETGRIITCDDGCYQLMGFATALELTGRNLKAFLPESDQGPSRADHPIMLCASLGIDTAFMRGILLRSDGTPMDIDYKAKPVWLEWGRRGAICVFTIFLDET